MTASPGAPYRPSWVQRQANRRLTGLLAKGKGPSIMRLLTVQGRRSGTTRSTPVVPVVEGDRTWVVSPFGEVGWVRDARARGRLVLQRGDERTTYAVHELATAEAVPVLRRYLRSRARFFVRSHVGVRASSSDDAIAAEAPHHPTFALTPIEPGGTTGP